MGVKPVYFANSPDNLIKTLEIPNNNSVPQPIPSWDAQDYLNTSTKLII